MHLQLAFGWTQDRTHYYNTSSDYIYSDHYYIDEMFWAHRGRYCLARTKYNLYGHRRSAYPSATVKRGSKKMVL